MRSAGLLRSLEGRGDIGLVVVVVVAILAADRLFELAHALAEDFPTSAASSAR